MWFLFGVDAVCSDCRIRNCVDICVDIFALGICIDIFNIVLVYNVFVFVVVVVVVIFVVVLRCLTPDHSSVDPDVILPWLCMCEHMCGNGWDSE